MLRPEHESGVPDLTDLVDADDGRINRTATEGDPFFLFLTA